MLTKGTYSASVVIQAVGTIPDSLVCPVTLTISKVGVGAINAGGTAVGAFEADKFFSGGQTTTTTTSVSTANVTNAAPAQVYQTERYGAMTYTITSCSPNTAYTVRLHFAEIYWTTAGQRLFNVRVNGVEVLTNLDIFAQAGGAFKALVKDVAATATSTGQIAIEFVNVTDMAKISALEWFPSSATQARLSVLRMQTAELFTAQFDKTKCLQIQVNKPGNHTVRIATVNGATVKVFAGVGRQLYRLDSDAIAGGMYVVNVSTQGRHRSACVVAGR